MSFGRNPHVAKAEAAEQKALDARDEDSRTRGHREAAHLWDRAAAREKPGKKRDEYLRNAERNRAIADGSDTGGEDAMAAPPPGNVIPFARKRPD